MDMDTLRIFMDVHHSGSITAAANSHYMSQPALGKRIAHLEKELGITLFLRGKGHSRVELTSEGSAFVDIAERMLMLYEQAQELREDAARQFLTIACIRSAHDILIPELIMRLKAPHPELCVTVEDHHTSEIMSLLENRLVDVGITQTPAVSKRLKSELLYKEPYRVVFQSNQAHGSKRAIHPAELNAAQGVFQAFDPSFEAWFDQWWHPYSVKLRVNTTTTAERYITEPEDWMIIPEAVAHALERKGFHAYEILGAPPLHHVYMTWHTLNQRLSLSWVQASLREMTQKAWYLC